MVTVLALEVGLVASLLGSAFPKEKRGTLLVGLLIGHSAVYLVVKLLSSLQLNVGRFWRTPRDPQPLSARDQQVLQFALLDLAKGRAPRSPSELDRLALRGVGEAVLVNSILRLQADDLGAVRHLIRTGFTGHPTAGHRFRLVCYVCAQLSANGDLCARFAAEAQSAGQPDDLLERRAFNALLAAHESSGGGSAAFGLDLLRSVRFETPVGPVPIPGDVVRVGTDTVGLWSGVPRRGVAHRATDSPGTFAEHLIDAIGTRIRASGARWRATALASTLLYVVGAAILAQAEAVPVAGVVVGAAAVLDVWDGWLAQQSDRFLTALYLDSVLDRAGEAAIAIGYYYYVTNSYGFGGIVPLIFVATAFYLPFTRAQAEALDLQTEQELFDRGVRWLILSGGMVISRPLYALALVTSLGLHTSLRRTLDAAMPLANRPRSLTPA